MRVLDQQHYRHPPRHGLDLADQRLVGPLLAPLRAHFRAGRSIRGNAQQARDQAVVLLRRVHPGEEAAQLAPPILRRVLPREPGGLLQLGDHRMQRALGVIGRAVVVQPRARLAAQPRLQRVGQPRLADARLALDQHHAARAVAGLAPAAQQQVQLLLAPDQSGEAFRPQRLEAAAALAFRQHPPRPHPFGAALERLQAEVLAGEQAADLPPGRRVDHDGARPGQGLQPGRAVGRVAHHGVRLPRAGVRHVAHHHKAAGDAHAGLQRAGRPGGAVQPIDALHDGQAGAGGALGVLLAGLRVAEVGEHAVADILGHEAAGAVDQSRGMAVVGGDHLAHVLGVELCGQRRGADQVAEHHRELAALCNRGGGRCSKGRRSRGTRGQG